MFKVKIACVGKIKESFYREAVDEYVKRLGRYCDVVVTALPDMPDSPTEAEEESKALSARFDGFMILADIGGKAVTSEEFSELIGRAYLTHPKVQFVIGGSRGVTDELRRRADARVSFGRVTYPHKLMRLIAAEQLYRAFTIAEGLPYHK